LEYFHSLYSYYDLRVVGLLSGIGISLHNVATFNPDYEIGKNKINGSITVTYKKVA